MMPPAIAVLAEVAVAHGVTLAVLRSREGRCKLYPARQEAAMRLRTERGLSYQQIGRMLGGRDHSVIVRMVCPEYRKRHATFHKERYARLKEARDVVEGQ